TSATKDIVIEVANFNPVTIRRGARKFNIQSDAQMRFEKGLSTEACPIAMARIVELILELAGGRLAGPVTDVYHIKYKPLKFSITTDEVNALIGVTLPRKEMVDVLRRLGFSVVAAGKKITATVPWWRDHDIESGRDLVEEIARVYGYVNIPGIIPLGLAPRSIDQELVWERRVRDISKGAGLSEVYTYSFVSKELLAKANYDASKMLHVQNPLSTDFEVMRTTLLPSLLAVASENQERFAEQRLFEIAHVYYPKEVDLPDEQLELGALFLGMKDPWRHAKGYVEHVFAEMGITKLSWRRLSTDSFWHPGRTVQAFYRSDLVATVGELSPKIAQNFKFDHRVALVDIPFHHVIPFASAAKSYTPLPAFPVAKRDLAIIVDSRVEYHDMAREIARAGMLSDPSTSFGVTTNVEWFDTYRGKNLPDGKKSIAMHLEFSAPDRTLEAKDVEAMMEKIALALKEKFQAEVRG
ncbi:MAG: phenylalanine--tRNA ligase subunit beta, partial [Patescibacteria group bacterium]